MATLTEYKIFCLTENQVVRGYTSGLLIPVCPHDHHHAVIPMTLVKVAELDEEALQRGDFCETRAFDLAVPGGVGSTGLDFLISLPAEIRNFRYQGSTGLLGDFIQGFLLGATGIFQYLPPMPLSAASTITMPLDTSVPANTINRIIYTNNNGAPKTFRFSTQLCY